MQDQYDESYIEQHFQEYCRCCLKNNAKKANKHKKFLDNIKLAADFHATFGIDITDMEFLPPTVCHDCYKMLMKIFDYRKTCLSTHHRLTEIKQKMTQIKVELVPMDDNETTDSENLLIPVTKDEEVKEEDDDPSVTVDLKIEAMPLLQSQTNSEELVVKKSKLPRKSTGEKQKSKRRLVQCPECGNLVQDIKGHARIHASNPYICHICDRKVTMKINMYQHLKTHFKIKDHACPDCDKRFASSSAARKHRVIHTDNRIHKCNLCDKMYKSKDVLNQHKKVVHFKQATFICEICETAKRFYSKTHYETHMRNVHAKQQKCPHCSYVLKNEKNLAKHLLTHGIGYENKQPEFKCPICSKICSRNNSFLTHMKCHSRPEGRGHKDNMKSAGKPRFSKAII